RTQSRSAEALGGTQPRHAVGHPCRRLVGGCDAAGARRGAGASRAARPRAGAPRGAAIFSRARHRRNRRGPRPVARNRHAAMGAGARLAVSGTRRPGRVVMTPVPPDRWPRVRELFERALDVAPAELPAWLAREGGGDSALVDEVRSLLSHHASAGAFLEG